MQTNKVQTNTVSLTRNPNLSAPKIDRSTPNEVMKKFGDQWWTGLSPEKCLGFVEDGQYLQALPLLNLEICSRQDVLDYFNNSWTLTEILFSSLKNEETYIRPPYHQLRHPLIFYYGHPAVLYLNKLRLAGLVEKPVDLYLEKVLETGVDEMSWDDMSKNEMEWPSVSEVKLYRKKVYDIVKDVILSHSDLDFEYRKKNQIKLNIDHPLWSLFMGMEHEKIHFETSSVLMRELPIELVETPRYWAPMAKANSTNRDDIKNSWVQVSGKSFTYGKSKEAPSYGWDNEYGTRSVTTKDFQVTKQLISNFEYYEFVASGAYQDDKFWQTEGLLWRKFRNTKRPTFWVAYGPEGMHDYKLRTIFEIIDMPWDWPAEVNYHEAQAYCRWKQLRDDNRLHYRLLTEAEFKTLDSELSEDPVLQKENYTINERIKARAVAKFSKNFNFNHTYSSATPVNASELVSGVNDLYGNVWQWAEDQFNPLDGFKVHKYYDDFSTPCFDGKHQMILGGSFISCGHEASRNARFHFRPHFFQHAGFRMAATLDGSVDNSSIKLKQTAEYVHPKRVNILEQMQNQNWWTSVEQPLEVSTQELNLYYDKIKQFVIKQEEYKKSSGPMGTAIDPYTNDVPENYKLSYQITKNFPENPEDFNKLIDFIQNDVAPLAQQPGHKGYMAYVAGAANSVSAPAQAMALVLNQFTGHYGLSPGLVSIEMEVVKWFTTLLNYSDVKSSGLLTSGGSQANMMALVAARNKLYNKSDLSKARFYASTQVHHCIGKALAFLGFPKESLVIIETNQLFQMNVKTLDKKIQQDKNDGYVPVAVVGTAGSTNTGAVDALSEIAEICKKHNVWFHVDGAYGALFMLTEKGQNILSGIEKSDSVALDPHKALQMPYGVGCLLVKNKNDLHITYAGSSSYMPPSAGLSDDQFGKIDFADISPELSRDPRGLRVWLPIKVYGIRPFKLNLEEKIKLAEYLNSELKKIPNIVVTTNPQLTIQTFKFKNSAATKKLMGWINSQGKLFLSGCEIEGDFNIRVCLLGYRLHYHEVKILVEQIKEGLKNV